MNSCSVSKLNKEHIRRQFDRSAYRYNKVAQMQETIVSDLLNLLSSSEQQPHSIGDIGCGTGFGLLALSKHYPKAELTGLDIAPSMLEVAAETKTSAKFVLGDIEELPINDSEFDLTWSSSAIQWCGIETAVAELARVTKPGGQLVVSTFLSGTLARWRDLWSMNHGSERFESVASVKNAFVQAGLEGIQIETKTYTQEFSSFRLAINSIRDLGAGNAEQDRSQGLFGVERYRSIKASVEQIIAKEGVLSLPYEVAFIVAKKSV